MMERAGELFAIGGNNDNDKNGHYTAHRAVVRSVSSYK